MRGIPLFLFCGMALAGGAPAAPQLLEPGQRVAGAAGGRHVYAFDAGAGQCACFSLDQGANDLVASVGLPNGGGVDFDGFDFDVEPIVFCASAPGTYNVSVRFISTEGNPAFTLTFDALRRAEPRVQIRSEALRHLTLAKPRDQNPDLPALLTHASEAFELFSRLPDARGAASASIRKGDLLYRLGRRSEAREAYRAAIEPARSAPDPHLLAAALTNSGLCSHELGEMEPATAYLEEAIGVWKQTGGPRKGLAAARNNRALVLSQAGEFRKAVGEYLEVEVVFEAIGDRESQAVAISNLGLAYARLGENGQACRSMDRAVALFREIHDPVALARALINRGYVYRLADDITVAAGSAQESVELLGPKGNPLLRADALFNLGSIRSRQGRLDEALSLQTQALELYRADKDMRGIASTLAAKGALDGELGRPEIGLRSLDEARIIYERLRIPDGAAAAWWQTAQIYRRQRNFAAAVAALDRAIEIVDSLRTRISGDHFRISFLASKRQFFDQYIEVAMQVRDDSPARFEKMAFDALERARARGLLDLVSLSREKIRSGLPPDLIFKRDKLQELVDYRATRASNILGARTPPPPEVAERARRDLEAAEEAYAEVEAEIEELSPAYAAATRPRPLKVDQIQPDLDDRTVLIAFWLGSERSYAWTVSHDSFQSHELPPAAEIDRRAVVASPVGPGRHREAEAARAWLSRELLEPLLRGRHFDKLVLLVSGSLEQTPFAALADPFSTPQGLPLGVTHEITYAPSASVVIALRAARKDRPRPPFRLAMFGDPVFGGPGTHLPRLLHTRKLGKDLASYGRSPDISIRLGEQATKANLTSATLRQYRMLLIASHIEFNQVDSQLSAIVLSGTDEQGRPVDHLVHALDVYNQVDLAADLAAIIGCRSGVGRGVWGEGALGFARAFQYAGARNVLATLWDVEEKPAMELTEVYFREMLGGTRRTPAAALRAAQADMYRRGKRDPYYFASLKLYGDWR